MTHFLWNLGASIHNSAGVEFGRAVMESSSMNIGLYPSAKIGKNAVHSVCSAEDYDLLDNGYRNSRRFFAEGRKREFPSNLQIYIDIFRLER